MLDATTFTKNSYRLLEGDMATQFLAVVLSQRQARKPVVERALLGRRLSRRSGEAMMRISRPLNTDAHLARKWPHRSTVNEKSGFNGTNSAVCRTGQFTGRNRCRPQTI
jgi:hypothetical protein